uniref:Putative secreted protein n=1 Tax=Anopheles marajoara TaxID=58244 RepID=A0A2M4CDW3_9DIPT
MFNTGFLISMLTGHATGLLFVSTSRPITSGADISVMSYMRAAARKDSAQETRRMSRAEFRPPQFRKNTAAG